MKSFPPAFVSRIEKILPVSEWESFWEMATEPLPKVIRTDNLGTELGWNLRSTLVPEAFFIEREDQEVRPLGKTLEHFTGQIYSQSLSSMLPVQVLDPKPGERLLDMCAAPGSKTTFCAQRMANAGLIVANEPSSSRSKKLVSNLNRLGVSNTVLLQSDGTLLDQFIAPMFDKVLLDAPCSSEGFGRRDARFFQDMWSESSIVEMSKLQKRLIVAGFNLLLEGGTMTYSTCTSAPEENEVVVQHLWDCFPGAVEILPINLEDLPHHPGLTAWEGRSFDAEISEKSVRLYPHLRSETWNSESFFVCLIRKKSVIKTPDLVNYADSSTHKFLKKNQIAEVVGPLTRSFGFPKNWVKDGVWLSKNGALFLTTKSAMSFCNHYLWRRAGLKILDKDKNITTEFAIKFGNLATKRVLDLSRTQTVRWLAGYDLEFEGYEEGFYIVKYKNYYLGWGKMLPGKLKNKLDRDRVFDF